MILLIGGAPRAGKTLLVRHLFEQYRFCPVNTDAITSAIVAMSPRVAEAQKVTYASGIEARSDALLMPTLRYAKDMSLTHENVVVDGETIYPRHVAAFADLFGRQNVRAVFLGLDRPNLATILEHEGPHGWLAKQPSELREKCVTDITARSLDLRREAVELRQRYIDMSRGAYERASQRALTVLTGDLESAP